MHSVTVVMSSYNGEKYIKDQIESIISQSGCEVNLIVRDDGSTDGTLDILQQYKREGKLDFFQGRNLKPAKSFLEGLKHTKDTDYYAFSDQDDIWQNNKLSVAISQLEMLNAATPNLYCSNLTAVDNDYNVLTPKLLPDKIVSDYKEILIRSPHIFGCTCVFNKVLRDYIVERELPQNLIMHDLWVALLAASMGTIIYDSSSYMMYRQHGDNHTGASLTFKEKMKGRWSVITGTTPFSMSLQAREFIKYVSEDELKRHDILDYTWMVANYKKSFRNKIKYIFLIDNKSMSLKQKIFHTLMILMDRL